MKVNLAVRRLALSILICFILSACGPGQFLAPTLTPTLTATFTHTPVLTLTPTATPPPTLTPTLTPTLGPVPYAILGEWENEDLSNGVITRIIIRFNSSAYSVQTWSKCEPEDCWWNNDTEGRYDVSNLTETTMVITWIFSDVETTLNLAILPDGRLKITSHDRFTGASSRIDMNFVYLFKKTGD